MEQTMVVDITTCVPDDSFTYAKDGGFTQKCPCGCGVTLQVKLRAGPDGTMPLVFYSVNTSFTSEEAETIIWANGAPGFLEGSDEPSSRVD